MEARTKFILEQIPKFLETDSKEFTLDVRPQKEGHPPTKVLTGQMLRDN